MNDHEFRLFCSELERYTTRRNADAGAPDAETYIVCAADQLAAEGIDHLPYPECASATWARIDAVLDENTIVPAHDPELVDA
ncbi:MAG TPA: hypothetical protein DCL06_02710 [Corynebacterium variabile]|uniref:Uncharacterized protein n=1 Tax=Corynebacterium variabile TaxID=1727 RepID=A0A3B9QSL9_9CORY|nr:hypothetical protein [Corynebacterium variabile]